MSSNTNSSSGRRRASPKPAASSEPTSGQPPRSTATRRAVGFGFGTGVAVGVLMAAAIGLGTLLAADEAWHRRAPASAEAWTGSATEWLRVGALHDDSPHRPPAVLYQFATHLLDGADAITTRLTPPNARALQLLFGYLHTASIHAACKLGVFDALFNHSLSLNALTTQLVECVAPPLGAAPLGLVDDWDGLPRTDCRRTERRVERLLRYLLAIGVVEQYRDGQWGLTPVGASFATAHPHSLRGAALNFGDDQFLPFALLDDTVRTGRSAYSTYHGEGQFERHRSHPEVGAHFDGAMTGLGGQFADNTALAVDFDWSPYRHVMEIGAGSGALLRRVLSANPHLRGTLFDHENVIARNRARWNTTECTAGVCPPNVRAASFAAGDFFDANSIAAASSAAASGSEGTAVDAFVLKQILHDWNDADALRILRATHDAAAAAASESGLPTATTQHVLVVDRVVGDRDTLLSSSGGRGADLVMLATFGDGARERSRNEFHALFRAARLRVVAEVPAARSAFHTFVCAVDSAANNDNGDNDDDTSRGSGAIVRD